MERHPRRWTDSWTEPYHGRFRQGARAAIKHRDYFDMGEFVYERIPVLRSIIDYIKSRLAGK
jgi:hypothetical protein